jgi:hypothetical protein
MSITIHKQTANTSTWLVALLLALGGCASNLITADQALVLSSGQGLAAVVLDTLDPITQVILAPVSNKGGELSIPAVPVGRHLFLLAAPAGRYCIHQFHYDTLNFKAVNDSLCFDVAAGHISYSGDFAPRVVDGTVVLERNDNYQDFISLLQTAYPRAAAGIPIAPR